MDKCLEYSGSAQIGLAGTVQPDRQPPVDLDPTGGGYWAGELGRGNPTLPRSNHHRLINPSYQIRVRADRIDPARTGFAPLKIFQKGVVEQAISTKRLQNMTV